MAIKRYDLDYHSRPELSASQVVCYLNDPIAFYHYHVAQDWPRPEPTPAMQFGTADDIRFEGGETMSDKKETLPHEKFWWNVRGGGLFRKPFTMEGLTS